MMSSGMSVSSAMILMCELFGTLLGWGEVSMEGGLAKRKEVPEQGLSPEDAPVRKSLTERNTQTEAFP